MMWRARKTDVPEFKESWEFSAGKVHRIVIETPEQGNIIRRREKSLSFDTSAICHELIHQSIGAASLGKSAPEDQFYPVCGGASSSSEHAAFSCVGWGRPK
jgi:hypothetical protein